MGQTVSRCFGARNANLRNVGAANDNPPNNGAVRVDDLEAPGVHRAAPGVAADMHRDGNRGCLDRILGRINRGPGAMDRWARNLGPNGAFAWYGAQMFVRDGVFQIAGLAAGAGALVAAGRLAIDDAKGRPDDMYVAAGVCVALLGGLGAAEGQRAAHLFALRFGLAHTRSQLMLIRVLGGGLGIYIPVVGALLLARAAAARPDGAAPTEEIARQYVVLLGSLIARAIRDSGNALVRGVHGSLKVAETKTDADNRNFLGPQQLIDSRYAALQLAIATPLYGVGCVIHMMMMRSAFELFIDAPPGGGMAALVAGALPPMVSSTLLEAVDGLAGALANRLATYFRHFELRYEPGNASEFRNNLSLNCRKLAATLRHVWGNTSMRQTMLVAMDVVVGFGLIKLRELFHQAERGVERDAALQLLVNALAPLFGAAVLLAISEWRGQIAANGLRLEEALRALQLPGGEPHRRDAKAEDSKARESEASESKAQEAQGEEFEALGRADERQGMPPEGLTRTFGGNPFPVTPEEAELIDALVRAPGRTISFDRIREIVRGDGALAVAVIATLNVKLMCSSADTVVRLDPEHGAYTLERFDPGSHEEKPHLEAFFTLATGRPRAQREGSEASAGPLDAARPPARETKVATNAPDRRGAANPRFEGNPFGSPQRAAVVLGAMDLNVAGNGDVTRRSGEPLARDISRMLVVLAQAEGHRLGMREVEQEVTRTTGSSSLWTFRDRVAVASNEVSSASGGEWQLVLEGADLVLQRADRAAPRPRGAHDTRQRVDEDPAGRQALAHPAADDLRADGDAFALPHIDPDLVQAMQDLEGSGADVSLDTLRLLLKLTHAPGFRLTMAQVAREILDTPYDPAGAVPRRQVIELALRARESLAVGSHHRWTLEMRPLGDRRNFELVLERGPGQPPRRSSSDAEPETKQARDAEVRMVVRPPPDL